ncbi:MAG: CehA/McbA family metallohydrolase [Acidobacteriota bacterium]|nr:CehA/McbA family metallohydrolase [Acidobacteriota bacterium]
MPLAPTFAKAPAGKQAPTTKPQALWFKGNLHTHTVNSDGDSTPDDVVTWYRERNYQFLVLTDHNYLTSVEGLNALHGADDKFLVVKGEEVTSRFGDKPLHVNGLEIERFVPPPEGGSSVLDVLQQMVDGIRAARGVPSINHPNFGWAISPDELGQVQRTKLFEVFNGHPTVNNLGGGGVPSLEETWDRILSSGKLLYGIAVDDAHYFKRPEDPAAPRPGKGWVHVRAARLEPRALVEALERGDFYSSTGVQMQAVDASASSLSLSVRTEPASKYRIQFIGRQGRVLSEVTTPTATYTFKGDEGYVRAKVMESNGKAAWIQPVPVGAAGPR